MVDFTGIRPKDPEGVWHIEPSPTPFDREQFAKIRAGSPLLISARFVRSLPHLRFYRGLVGVVAEGLGMHPDALHSELRFKAGLVKQILLSGGRPFVELKSTAFSAMDQIEFNEYCLHATNILFRDFLPEVKRSDIWRKVEQIAGCSCPW